MNATPVCFPRLPLAQAAAIWNDLRVQSFEEIGHLTSSITTAGAEFYPVATARCTDGDLAELRAAVVAEARLHGFPDMDQARQKTEFDQAVSRILYERMNILPADAASVDVWNFINIRLLPDVAIWRYGHRSGDGARWEVTEARLFAMTRTIFGRLWWRAFLLGPDIAVRLKEDESVQLTERPLICGYAPLARAIANRHLSTFSTGKRMMLLRDAMKRFTRRLVVVSAFLMSEDQIADLVEDVFLESEQAMKAAEAKI